LNRQLCQFHGRHPILSLGYRSYTELQFNLELDGSFRRHSWHIIGKHV
jgi:hypothetical protein